MHKNLDSLLIDPCLDCGWMDAPPTIFPQTKDIFSAWSQVSFSGDNHLLLDFNDLYPQQKVFEIHSSKVMM